MITPRRFSPPWSVRRRASPTDEKQMLKRRRSSLTWKFFFWILVGLASVLLMLWARESSCTSIPALSWLCDEARFTDLLLAYFTYCLVVVGWFGIKSNELTVQNLERAFLSVGPTRIEQLYRSSPTTPFVRLTLYVHNTGRTGAIIKRVYGEFSRVPPDGRKPMYKNGNDMITDLSVAANEKDELSPVAFEDDFHGDQFFWGYLEYLDIFKIEHKSRFCAAIFPASGKYQIAGNEHWRECD
jgi:hypothetical protein